MELLKHKVSLSLIVACAAIWALTDFDFSPVLPTEYQASYATANLLRTGPGMKLRTRIPNSDNRHPFSPLWFDFQVSGACNPDGTAFVGRLSSGIDDYGKTFREIQTFESKQEKCFPKRTNHN